GLAACTLVLCVPFRAAGTSRVARDPVGAGRAGLCIPVVRLPAGLLPCGGPLQRSAVRAAPVVLPGVTGRSGLLDGFLLSRDAHSDRQVVGKAGNVAVRSEERRVGKECRARGWAERWKRR